MKRATKITSILVLAMVASLAFSAGGAQAGGKGLPRRQMLRLVNERRRAAGEPRLRMNISLAKYARHHSHKMADRGYIFHTKNLADPLRGMRWSLAGENVGAGGDTVREMFRAFMNSAPHRANIMQRAYRHAGIGIVKSSGYLWVTMDFYG